MYSDHRYKILLLGEEGVGRSSLVTQYVDKIFMDDQEFYTQELIRVKTLDCSGLIVDLELWDLPQESIDVTLLSEINGAMFCYNINDKNSWTKLSHWIEQVDKYSSDMVCKVIVGTKSDLERKVDIETAKAMSERLNIPLIETSAKIGSNVRTAFKAIVKELLTSEYPWGKYDDMQIRLEGVETERPGDDSSSVHSLMSNQGGGGLCCVVL